MRSHAIDGFVPAPAACGLIAPTRRVVERDATCVPGVPRMIGGDRLLNADLVRDRNGGHGKHR
ncbi:hypothetical protein [Frankia sp. AgKG'84/4]|uniref:hypothetical protein n=1 Tax=Frankia sp. AgKG'84/4 TaxID=573490 RepID=UPI002029C3BF|nr:hypothetical protein [Frankia sp. AgKG'84/4]